MNLQVVLQGLYDAGISTGLMSVWDAGWEVRLGGLINAQADSLDAAACWLHERALQRYPDSKYAINAVPIPQLRVSVTRDLPAVLEALYESEFDTTVYSGERGWTVELRDLRRRTEVNSLDEAAGWLHEQVMLNDPGCLYAARALGIEWTAARAAD